MVTELGIWTARARVKFPCEAQSGLAVLPDQGVPGLRLSRRSHLPIRWAPGPHRLYRLNVEWAIAGSSCG
jgi:hypothetical protein